MAAKKALVVYGGWDGHQPKEVGQLFKRVLTEDGFEVEMSDSLSAFDDGARLKALDLIVPHWTMDKIGREQVKNVSDAVISGVGLAGCHGGMCDAFRENTFWQFMTGGQFVDHPGNDGTNYTVKPTGKRHPITDGIGEFAVSSEQYYMHVDPANNVLMTTHFPVADGPHLPNGEVEMPVVWTRMWGKGRVYYNSLGHQANILEREPVLTLMRRGFKWAAEGKALAR